jgi:3'-phosphoadenosine 5'-phosphosulfate sulfotransferase (PAPS reductase)/FAD synthetase
MIDFLEMGKVWKNSKAFIKKFETACYYVEKAFKISKNPYLAISGGKDSIAMVGVVEEVAKRIGREYTLWGHISDASFPGTIETIEAVKTITDRKLIIDASERSAFEVLREKVEINTQFDKQFGKKGYFFEAIKNNIINNDFDLAFVGVRAYESKRRMKAVKAHGHLFVSNVPIHCNVCYPLAWFKLEDVGAVIEKYNLPIHPIYSKKGVNSVQGIRLGYLTATDLLHKGTATFIKLNYPEMFEKLIDVMPEIKNYT